MCSKTNGAQIRVVKAVVMSPLAIRRISEMNVCADCRNLSRAAGKSISLPKGGDGLRCYGARGLCDGGLVVARAVDLCAARVGNWS